MIGRWNVRQPRGQRDWRRLETCSLRLVPRAQRAVPVSGRTRLRLPVRTSTA